ncbi:unnamed protein product [Candidula unifasciata]|uniref:Tyrosine-protein kinase ephrin type A/B receptor-like domain-containing protein n=1 Tax=Candidula unifasciata TaxID=100452 RepID=A0A8S3ZIX8_9EUPU|nr:unnamed protein product [Candidula unifasciata]
MTFIVLLSLAFTLVFSQLNDKLPEIDTGSTCKELEKPEHGMYQCRTTEEGVQCKLTCDEGYTLPINEYNNDGQHIPLQERGFYLCTDTPGGWMWRPIQFYDCVPKVDPAYFVYYYSLTMPHPCSNDNRREEYLDSFNVNNDMGITKRACMRELTLNCFWTYDIRCLNGAWQVDAWLRMPFSPDMLDTFDVWFSTFEGYSQNESSRSFIVEGQQGNSWINRKGFYIECPMATRIENDYTCRGCSKGYYMSQSLLECLPCPPQRYQDHDYSHTCKPCPSGGNKETTGLTKLIDCFHFSRWEEGTSLERIFAGLGCVVIFSSLLLYYRSQIRNEPDGRHREVYVEHPVQAIGGGPLQRMMRELHSMDFYPSQFDNMSVSAQLASETTRLVTQSGKSKFVSLVKKRATSLSSSGSSGSSDSSSD